MGNRTFEEWLIYRLSAPVKNDFDSAHLDMLNETVPKSGLELISFMIDAIKTSYKIGVELGLKSQSNIRISFKCLLDSTDHLSKWHEASWNLIGNHSVSPEVYIYKGMIPHDHLTERYSIGLKNPIDPENFYSETFFVSRRDSLDFSCFHNRVEIVSAKYLGD